MPSLSLPTVSISSFESNSSEVQGVRHKRVISPCPAPPPYKANSQATKWSVCRTSTRCHVAHSWARGLSVALSLGFWLDPNYLGVREKFPTASLEAEGTVVTSLAQASRVPGRTLGSLIPSPSKGELGGLVCEDWPV